MRNAFILPLILALAGCATAGTDKADATKPYVFSYTDNPAQQRIDLELTSLSKRPFCLTISDWPNPAGKMDTVKEYAVIRIGADSYTMTPYTSEYCPKCGVKVQKGDVIKGMLRYADFGIPAEQYALPKTLIMTPRTPRC